MQSLWADFLKDLGQPEYVHVLLNPLPVYGLAAGLFSLLLALLFRSRSGQAIALVLILLTSASAWPVAHYGEAAYDRVYSMSYAGAQKWLNWHAYLGERIVWVYYLAAVAAAVALAGLWKTPRWHRAALWITVALSAVSLGLGGFLSFVGGKIRHDEFRHGAPPAWAHTAPQKD